MIHFTDSFTLGASTEKTYELKSPRLFRPNRILSNADFEGCVYLTYVHKSGKSEKYDLIVASRFGQTINWAPLEQGEPLKLSIRYTGRIPQGFWPGTEFELTITIEGEP